MKVYIAGKITNNPNYKEDFKKAEDYLVEQGHSVINPCKCQGFSYRDYIDMGLCELMHCDAIYMLNGWMGSVGARLEFNYAHSVGMNIFLEGETVK